MEIHSVNNSLYLNKGINSNYNKAMQSFSGTDKKSDDVKSVYLTGGIGRSIANLTKIFHRPQESEEIKAKKIIPYVLDKAYIKAGIISEKQTALTYRYGNADISQAKPEIIEKVKNNLKTMGIENINDDNLKLMKVADGDKERYVYKRFSYYNEAGKKSVIFNPQGDMDYQVTYKYSKKGNIIGYDITDIYSDNNWEVL